MDRRLTRPDGVSIAWEARGEGPPVLLLHGFTMGGAMWDATGLPGLLAPRARLLIPDIRGHGRSDRPRDPALYGGALIGDALALLDAEGVGAAHLVGFSLGAEIALRLAAEAPGRAASLLLAGSGWSPPEAAAIYAASAEWMRRPDTVLFAADPDLDALEALSVAMAPILDVPRAAVARLRLPARGLVGELDDERPYLERLIGALDGFEVEILPGRDHRSSWRDPGFASRIARFLDPLLAATG